MSKELNSEVIKQAAKLDVMSDQLKKNHGIDLNAKMIGELVGHFLEGLLAGFIIEKTKKEK